MRAHRIALLGTGLIGSFYATSILGQRRRDRIEVVYSRDEARARDFAGRWGIPRHTTDMAAAIKDPEVDVVVIGIPNHLHEEAVTLAAEAGKAILCTKPLGRNAEEAKRMLDAAERAGVFHGYLEDLVYTPKTLKSIAATRAGAVGDVLWVRSRETHPGPHSAWFWSPEQAGGGSLIDMGCHCIEIIRSFVGKENRPLEVMCWTDTLVHPIEAEDHAIALIRFESGAVGQVETSWAFRGGMDLRDEVAGTEGTIMLNHWLRTGFEMFSAAGSKGYVAEKLESETGWMFPVGDEPHALGYVPMFVDMFDALEEGRPPTETFYDGYVVNAVIDACYRSARTRQWEPVVLDDWRAREPARSVRAQAVEVDGKVLIKKERLPDGTVRSILRDLQTGEITQTVNAVA
ncbi:MAG TPA: Gfo/Idh/MocA family oxidoreductase [Longimicrobiaceae bacterium]